MSNKDMECPVPLGDCTFRQKCQKEKCAWWVSERRLDNNVVTEGCAIKVMAGELWSMNANGLAVY